MSNECNGYNKSDWENDISSEVDFWSWAFTEAFEKNNDVFHLDEDAGKPFVNRDIAPAVGIF